MNLYRNFMISRNRYAGKREKNSHRVWHHTKKEDEILLSNIT